MAALFFYSSARILKQSIDEMREVRTPGVGHAR